VQEVRQTKEILLNTQDVQNAPDFPNTSTPRFMIFALPTEVATKISFKNYQFKLLKKYFSTLCSFGEMLPLETKQSGGKLLPHSDLGGGGGGLFLGGVSRSFFFLQL
jgi:hypothetical protein